MRRTSFYRTVIFNTTSLICGIINMLVCLTVRIVSGSPFEVIHRLNCGEVLPPIWLFNLFWLIGSFVAGYASGIIINEFLCGRLNGRNEICAYRGGLFFVALLFLAIIWYPLFFVKEALFLSLLIAIISLVCAFFCGCIWFKSEKVASILIFAYFVWLFYILIVNFLILFLN